MARYELRLNGTSSHQRSDRLLFGIILGVLAF
jgi:hypothetical protein